MYFLDPRVNDLLPRARRAQLSAYLNLLASQAHGHGSTMQMQSWFAERLGVTVRTIKRWESELRALGCILVEPVKRLNRRAVSFATAMLEKLAPKRGQGTRASRGGDTDGASRRSRMYGARVRGRAKTSASASNAMATPMERETERIAPRDGFGAMVISWLRGGCQGPNPALAK